MLEFRFRFDDLRNYLMANRAKISSTDIHRQYFLELIPPRNQHPTLLPHSLSNPHSLPKVKADTEDDYSGRPGEASDHHKASVAVPG